jgi:hypothetical protein
MRAKKTVTVLTNCKQKACGLIVDVESWWKLSFWQILICQSVQFFKTCG